jgi:uncharacterized membrane protein
VTLEAVVRVPAPTGRFRRTLAAAQVHRWSLVVCGAMSAWSAALFVMARADYENFRLARNDLGNMVQAVWTTAHGRPLESTDFTGEQITRLGSHVDPILTLFAPFWLLVPSPLTLVALQLIVCAAGAVPVFWLGRRHLGSEQAAALMALAYLAYPWLAWTAMDAVHPVTLAIPLFLFAIWSLDGDRLWAFVVCAALVLAAGELMGFVLAALGLWYAFTRRRLQGLLITMAGLAWTALCIHVIVPVFRGEASPFYEHYRSIGGSPEDAFWTGVTDPEVFVSELTTGHDFNYLFWLAAPLVCAFLLAPALASVALPQLLANGLSERVTFVDPRAHYVAAVIPFLVAGSVLGVARVPASRRVRMAAVVLFACSATSVLAGPWPGVPTRGPSHYTDSLPASRLDALRAALALVPDGVAVSASNDAGSHLSARRYVYTVPVIGTAEWIVVDTWDPSVPAAPVGYRSPEQIKEFVSRVEANPRWRRVFERDGVLLFKRVTAA